MKQFYKMCAYVAGFIGVAVMWCVAILTVQQYRVDDHMSKVNNAS